MQAAGCTRPAAQPNKAKKRAAAAAAAADSESDSDVAAEGAAEEVCEYELQREARIANNAQRMQSMGLPALASQVLVSAMCSRTLERSQPLSARPGVDIHNCASL